MSEAREQPAGALEVVRWSEEVWSESADAWGQLLARSSVDPLFLSWDWLTLWWQHFGVPRGYELYVLAVYREGSVVGLAPLYRARVARGGIVRTRSIQFIGLSFRDDDALISEYLDVIAAPEEIEAVRMACVAHLQADDRWSECIVGYTRAAEQWEQVLRHSGAASYIRRVDEATSYQAELTHGFSTYLSGLGQSTRRSLWNLRRRLATRGAPRMSAIAPDDVASGFQELNQLHLARWGRPAFSGMRLQFHEALARRLATRGELALTQLRVGEKLVSVLYDVRKGTRQYNLKLGFDPAFDRGVSVGLLHFGYAMEAACADGVTTYDFLAGPGRKTDFKSHLGETRHVLRTLQMLRGAVLPRLYRWHDNRRRSTPPI